MTFRLVKSMLGLLGATLFAAAAPFVLSDSQSGDPSTVSFPGWPQHYEGKPLTALQLSERERLFVQGFPGAVGRFSDGSREIIIRWVESPTRRLHPAMDCFKGVGYAITPLPVQRNRDGTAMSCFTASKGTQSLQVCEYLSEVDVNNSAKTWADVSSWYWHAMFDTDPRGWWSVVVAENPM